MDVVKPRVDSIDILRAFTMLLMIFVNDLWNVRDAPGWLEHTAKFTDGMGLADTVFPAFLVIVGMSLPFAVANRKKKGDSDALVLRHISERSFALIVMGLVLVNGESIDAGATGMSGDLYDTLACLAFICIWNAFPQHVNKSLILSLKIMGWLILLILAWIYRGGEDGIHRFITSWWGILGLIGWAYLLNAIVFVSGKRKLLNMIIFWSLCILLNAAFHQGWIMKKGLLSSLTSPFAHGAMPALVSIGVISSLLYIRRSSDESPRTFIITLLSISAGLILLGFSIRPLFIISKILATPSWVMICSGITLLVFAFVYWLADVRHKTAWANIIRPAGTNTLLCYLLPYFAYALFGALQLALPEVLLTGTLGLVKTFVFALLIVNLAGLLMKVNLRLRL